jgi:hypothetical protein
MGCLNRVCALATGDCFQVSTRMRSHGSFLWQPFREAFAREDGLGPQGLRKCLKSAVGTVVNHRFSQRLLRFLNCFDVQPRPADQITLNAHEGYPARRLSCSIHLRADKVQLRPNGVTVYC